VGLVGGACRRWVEEHVRAAPLSDEVANLVGLPRSGGVSPGSGAPDEVARSLRRWRCRKRVAAPSGVSAIGVVLVQAASRSSAPPRTRFESHDTLRISATSEVALATLTVGLRSASMVIFADERGSPDSCPASRYGQRHRVAFARLQVISLVARPVRTSRVACDHGRRRSRGLQLSAPSARAAPLPDHGRARRSRGLARRLVELRDRCRPTDLRTHRGQPGGVHLAKAGRAVQVRSCDRPESASAILSEGFGAGRCREQSHDVRVGPKS
jgi:hypothetical protein